MTTTRTPEAREALIARMANTTCWRLSSSERQSCRAQGIHAAAWCEACVDNEAADLLAQPVSREETRWTNIAAKHALDLFMDLPEHSDDGTLLDLQRRFLAAITEAALPAPASAQPSGVSVPRPLLDWAIKQIAAGLNEYESDTAGLCDLRALLERSS